MYVQTVPSTEDTSKSPTRGRIRWRLVVLVSVGIIELAIVSLLRSKGFWGTIDSVGWLASGALLISPLCIAAGLLAHRGGRFSVLALMSVTALVAIFLSSLLPTYIRERSSRMLYNRLISLNVNVTEDARLDKFYESIGYSYTQPPSSHPAVTPLWVNPLVNRLADFRVEEVQTLKVRSDEQIYAVLGMADRLINLREITVFGSIQHGGVVSEEAISALAKNLPPIEALSFIGVDTPYSCFSQFRGIRYLTVWADDANGAPELTKDQAIDLAATPGLEILSVGKFRIDHENLSIIAEARDLQHLDLVKISAKRKSELELELARPPLSVRILP